jgi:hypothetical protein
MMASTYTEDVPLSILDGSDGMLRVTFSFTPGGAPSPRTIAEPMGGDDGWPPEIEVTSARYLREDGTVIPAVVGLGEHEEERVIEWLFDHWEPPTGPDPDDERDRRRDERLTDG